MMRFTVLAVLLAVAAVQSKKYYGGCVGTLGGCGGVALAAGPAVARVAVAAPAVIHRLQPEIPHTIRGPPAGPLRGWGVGYYGCVDRLTGCGEFARLGYCDRKYYRRGCCNTCGIYKKK